MMNYRVLITILFLCSLNVQALDIEIKADKVNPEHLQAIKDAITLDENNNDRFYAKYKIISQDNMNPVVKLEKKEHAPTLENLDCFNCFIANNDGDIISASISDGLFVDLSHLGKIKTIKYLLLPGIKILHFDAISHFKKLTYIYTSRNKINKNINLSNPQLAFAIIKNNKVNKITLNNLMSLKYLDISNNDVAVLNGLDSLKCLEIINIKNNNIKNLSGLGDAKVVRGINMNGNITANLSFLANLKELEYLLVDLDEEWKDYKVFGSSTKLKELYISVNSDLHRLNQLPKIESLKILSLNTHFNPSGKGIRSLQGLEHFPNLEELILRDNKVTKIEGLEHLPKLTSLTLDKNPIRQWKGLEKASDKLETLSIEDVIETVRPSNQPTLKVSEKERVIRLLRDRGVTVFE